MAIDHTPDQDVTVELSHNEPLSDLVARGCGCSQGNSELNKPLVEPNYTSPWANWTRDEKNSTWHPDSHGTYHMKHVPCRMSMLLNNYTTGACFFSETLQIPHSEGFTAACIAAVILAMLLECTRRGLEELDRFLLNDHALQKKEEKTGTENGAFIQERQAAYRRSRGEERVAIAAIQAQERIDELVRENEKQAEDWERAIADIKGVILARVVAERAQGAVNPPAEAAAGGPPGAGGAVQANDGAAGDGAAGDGAAGDGAAGDGAAGAVASGALPAPGRVAEAGHQEANGGLPAAGGLGDAAAGARRASIAAAPLPSDRALSAPRAAEAVNAGAMAQARPPAEARPSGIFGRLIPVAARRPAPAASSDPDAIRPATPREEGRVRRMPENNENAAQCEEPGVAQADNAGANERVQNAGVAPNHGQPPRIQEFLPPEVKKFRPNWWQTMLRALLHSAQFVLAFFLMLFAMYMNIYIIISICLGIFFGSFLFQWDKKMYYMGYGEPCEVVA